MLINYFKISNKFYGNINDMLEQKKQQQFGNKQITWCVCYAACFFTS